jgi:hypothetical protein
MIDPKTVKQQLHKIGFKTQFFGKPELDELPKILIPGEQIQHIQNGRYGGGYATLCATNHRLLLIDKKFFYLNVEDIRYDMIAEVDFGQQLIGATIHIRSFSKDLKFQSFKKPELREFTGFIQRRVMELRGQQMDPHNARPNSDRAHAPAIPIQVFETGNGNDLTDSQAQSLIPLDQERWYKVNPSRKLVNPYSQTPLITRRRVGRFNFADPFK